MSKQQFRFGEWSLGKKAASSPQIAGGVSFSKARPCWRRGGAGSGESHCALKSKRSGASWVIEGAYWSRCQMFSACSTDVYRLCLSFCTAQRGTPADMRVSIVAASVTHRVRGKVCVRARVWVRVYCICHCSGYSVSSTLLTLFGLLRHNPLSWSFSDVLFFFFWQSHIASPQENRKERKERNKNSVWFHAELRSQNDEMTQIKKIREEQRWNLCLDKSTKPCNTSSHSFFFLLFFPFLL